MQYVEITQEAFKALAGDTEALDVTDQSGARIESYRAHGVNLKLIINYYSAPVVQYYIQDINA